MKQSLHIRRAVQKGYGPSTTHHWEPLTNKCTVCGVSREDHKDKPTKCFPIFGGEEL